MVKSLTPELKATFRKRIRHIHIPDAPPLYAPRSLPGNIRDFLQSQIIGQRYIAEANADSEPNEATADPIASMRAWLRQASPPPTVLSFTRRPTYVLPKHYMDGREPWEVEYLTAKLKGHLDVVFPKPPNWSSKPFKPRWEAEDDDETIRHNPLAHKWEPGVMIMPCAEPMYFGPGQLSIWPVMDLQDNFQRGKHITNKYQYERLLEDTTIQVLKREFGLDAFSIPGKSGVWVESLIPPPELSDVDSLGVKSFEQTPLRKQQNIRRIATVHADFVDNITRFGVSIHVGQPGLDVDRFDGLRTNPWAPIRQDSTTTSIVYELALKGFVPRRNDPQAQEIEHRSNKKSLYLQTAFDESSPYISRPLQAIPYSLVCLRPGLRLPTSMGLDNRDLSTAWAHEFARQLGLLGGIVDHLSNVYFPSEATSLPSNERNIGFMARPVMGEDQLIVPYEQVEVPAIQLKEQGPVTKDILQNTMRIETKDGRISSDATAESWAVSWPLYYHNLTGFLTKSIRGLSWDTRLTQLIRNQTVAARIDRRWGAIEEAQVLQKAWRVYQNTRSSDKMKSVSEAVMADIMSTTQDMVVILQGLEVGRINTPKKKLLAKTEYLQKLLESRKTQTANEFPAHKSGEDEIIQTAVGILEQAAMRLTISESEAISHTEDQHEPPPDEGSTKRNQSSEEGPTAQVPPETHETSALRLENKTLASEPGPLGQPMPKRTPMRAVRRDPAPAHIIKPAKSGPFTLRANRQPSSTRPEILPTKREMRERNRREKLLSHFRDDGDKMADTKANKPLVLTTIRQPLSTRPELLPTMREMRERKRRKKSLAVEKDDRDKAET